jgi:CHAT domain-containing protein
LLACTLWLTGSACKRPTYAPPDQIYQEAWLNLKRGDQKAALTQADGALLRFRDPKTEWYWRFTLLKAEVLVQLRLNKESLALIGEPIPAAYAKTDLAVWQKLTQGMANCFLLNFPESERLLADAERLASSNSPGLLGEVSLRQGTLAFFRGDTGNATTAYSQTLRLAREQKDAFLEAAALGSLGLVATRQEHYDEAIDRDQEALQLSRSVGAHNSESKILGNLGWEYLELGDYDNALVLFEQAEEAARQAGRISSQINWSINIGNVYFKQGKYDLAEAAYRKALDLARSREEKTSIVECLENLAVVDIEKGDTETAQNHSKEVQLLLKFVPDNSLALSASLIAGRIASSKHEFGQAERYFQDVIRYPSVRKSLQWEAEARSARVYWSEGKKQQAEGAFLRSLGTIEEVRTSVTREESRLSFLSSAISFYSDYIDFLMVQNRWYDALEVAELSRARTLAEGLGASPMALKFPLLDFHPQQIARRLHATLFFYWLGQDHSYLWVITPAKTVYFKLAKASDIEPVIKSYRKVLLEMHDARDAGSSEGKQLYTMLVEPAKKLIPGGSRVIVLPSERLFGLNFETLIVPDPQPHFWIEDVTLTTGSSLSLLASSATRSAAKEKSLFLVGDTESPGPAFPPLPQVREEMKQIEKYFPKSQTKVLEGKQATPTAYLGSNPENFSYVHFVAHGTASQTRPLESAVILSKEGDSYKLYARDIVQHHLNASLVTISACNGSGTRAYSGEGLVGLSWAFLRAGAHNVIGALWEVSEASTPQLMDAFYGELFQNKDPATALRDAKLRLLHSPDPDSVFKKPFYWAPFQLYAGS